jgi:hypothetical protein
MAMKRARSNYARRNVRRKYNAPRSNNMLASRYRKRASRKRSMRRGKSAVRRSLPDYTTVALKWTQTFITSITGTPSNGYMFNLNSIHDLNASGGTGQPFGYDQYSAFFQKYRVFAVKYKADFYNPIITTANNTNDLLCTCWCGPSGSLPAGTDNNILKQLPGAYSRTMSLKSGSSRRITLKGFKMMYKLQGVSKAEYNTDVTYEAFIEAAPGHSQNPGAMPRMLVTISDLTSAATAGSMQVDMEFVIYARLFRRKMLGLS